LLAKYRCKCTKYGVKDGKRQRLDDPMTGGVDHSLEAVFDPQFGEKPGYVVSCGEGPYSQCFSDLLCAQTGRQQAEYLQLSL
jgi:hypothetical protein